VFSASETLYNDYFLYKNNKIQTTNLRKEREELVQSAISLEKKLEESQRKEAELFRHNLESTDLMEEARWAQDDKVFDFFVCATLRVQQLD
jgi:hypothetical protein